MLIMTVEVLIIFVLIAINGFFALAEIAIVTARKSKLRHLANMGNKKAKAAVSLAEEPATFLSSVQVGITLVGILSGAFGGATIAENLADSFEKISWLAPYAESVGLIIVVLFILFLSVVLGELVPKQLAMTHPERYAMAVSIPMKYLSKIAGPLVKLFGGSSGIVLKSIGVKQENKEDFITDEEITSIVDEGVNNGSFEEIESYIVERVLRLDDREIKALMTHRVDVAWIDEEGSVDDMMETMSKSPFTAYPVCRGNVDNIVGVVYGHDIYQRLLNKQEPLTPEIIRKPCVMPSNMQALKAVNNLRQSGEHLAVVVNEHGEMDGIVTADNILESLMGTLYSPDENEIVTREDGSWLVDGATRIDDMRDIFPDDIFPEDEVNEYHTLAGFIIYHLGSIPKTGDHILWEGFRFEVVDKDGQRIDRVLICKQQPE
jgi:putative hemolysin